MTSISQKEFSSHLIHQLKNSEWLRYMNNQKLDTYLGLCTEVYDLSKPSAPEDAYAFYRSYVANAEGAILEPMCGTGRFLLPLLEEGFDVQGFDASEYMLDALYAKANRKNLTPNVWKAFIKDLVKPERYSLIFIPSGSFCLIIDPDEVKAALETFYNHLSENGILLFEAETLKSVPTLGVWHGSFWQRPDGKRILLSSCSSMEDNVLTSIGKYELIENNTILHTEVEELKVRIYQPDELTLILKEAGFKGVKIVKAFERGSSPDENDESIVYECRI
jgi:SAM-dependent methyltransferase